MLRAGHRPQSPTVRHRRWAALLVALVLALSSPLWLHSPRAAADTTGPCAINYVCVGASTLPSAGSTSGGGGGGGGANACYYGGKPVDCSNQYGALDPANGCYYMEAQPQPPANDPLWAGKGPADGAFYLQTCPNQAGGDTVEVFIAGGPPAAAVTPAALALRARDAIHLGTPVVHTAPGGTALVGAPIWLWIDTGGNAWAGPGPDHGITKVETDGALTVTLTVWSTGITWDMGDGGLAQCSADAPGASYAPSDGDSASPQCGYTYHQPSANQPGERYAITATVGWHARWTSSVGVGGELDVDSVAGVATTLRVEELQVLNQPTNNS
ncbi:MULTISPECIES: hypothetical protein [Streptacidiphilus]|uniref:ATP/GTP-binding protein n=1 Tax=Streptacidiphilus cavernicola TaxID=3342716 RepID=A0ABV6UUI1_9ACTN|nr:hypothetical protein [Streptacidiphilus jeojiense]